MGLWVTYYWWPTLGHVSLCFSSLHAAVTLSASLYYGLNRTWYHYYGTGSEPKIPLTLGSLVGILLGLGLAIGVVLAVGALCYFQVFIINSERILQDTLQIIKKLETFVK